MMDSLWRQVQVGILCVMLKLQERTYTLLRQC